MSERPVPRFKKHAGLFLWAAPFTVWGVVLLVDRGAMLMGEAVVTRAFESRDTTPADIKWTCGRDCPESKARGIVQDLPPFVGVDCDPGWLRPVGACCIVHFDGGVVEEIHVFRKLRGYEVEVHRSPTPILDLAGIGRPTS